MDTSLQFSFTPGEIVAAGTTLEVRTERPVEIRSAQGAVGLRRAGRPLGVLPTLAGRRRVIRVTTDGLEPGGYELTVGEMLDGKGTPVAEPVTVPFVVGALRGRVPTGFRVEQAVHLAVGELGVDRLAPGTDTTDGGRYLELVKAVHRDTGERVELAFDEDGRSVDAAAILDDLGRRRTELFGRMHETLWDHLRAAKESDRVDVVIWPRINHDLSGYQKPTDRPMTEPHPEARRSLDAVRRSRAGLDEALARIAGPDAQRRTRPAAKGRGRDMAIDVDVDVAGRLDDNDVVPAIHATLTIAQIRALAESDAVGGLFLDDRTAINDLGNSIAIARSDLAHTLGFDGTGVRVAVFEDGPSVTTNLTFAGRYTSSPSASNHARLTSAIIKNTEANRPHGHAPDCRLYSANSSDNAALRWAVNQGCTVISQSFHRSSEPGGAGLQADDILKDYLALHWPYPTIVQAAGNFWQGDADNIQPPSAEYVNHKGYNTLSVGNHDDAATAMSGDSVFRNPRSTHGDRELPELAANGTAVSANGQTMSGTSFAAPAVAGVTALLQDVDPVLRSWPEGCRAILLASAGRNVAGGTWWSDVATRTDARDGSGAVDAESGVRIAQQRRTRNAPATSRGWDVGTLSSADVGGDGLATFRHHVTVPLLLRSPTVKVALAWDSKVTSLFGLALSSSLTVDLDLIVRNSRGQQVAASASWDNSYEIVEFAATRGATYEIVIRRWSGTDNVWYGIAWTVNGISLLRPPVLGEISVLRPLRT
jgi:hypothetical protein